ncbi:hypothetical protein [Nocardioides alcanivorans]|uniref:hypothetical protein n=1 Tax=Nocardioides alcanivorans TaxID=2897352 RepID=UPI001F2B1DCE|nr:hypothetical protein [Nocardioides alcanivorans]
MLTPLAQELVQRYRAHGRFELRRSWKVGVVAIVFVAGFAALFIDLALSNEPRPGYIGLIVFSPVLVIGLVFGVRQLLPAGSVVVDSAGIHLDDRSVAWAEIAETSVENTPGWRAYRYVRLTLKDGEAVDLPLMLAPGAHDQWFAINHLRDE